MTDTESNRPLRPRAWVTGAAGLIGHYLVEQADETAGPWEVRGLTHAELDLLDWAAVRQEFRRDQPALVIHCAALSRSPVCEANPELARRINVEAAVHLAELASEIPFLFFSSDLVFDGKQGGYRESDRVNPLSVYGETKARAEELVLRNPRHTVVRTSLNGGKSLKGDRGFNEELRRAWRAGRMVRLFEDEYRSPLPANVTARATWELARANAPGLYHIAGSERLSRWQIGQLVAERWPHFQPRLEKTSLREYQGAPRAPDTSLNCQKVQPLLSFKLPSLSEWLRDHPKELF